MKYIEFKLTEEQTRAVIEAMEWWLDTDNEPATSQRNRFGQRIIDKVKLAYQGKQNS